VISVCITHIFTFYDTGWPKDNHDWLKLVAFYDSNVNINKAVLTVSKYFFVALLASFTFLLSSQLAALNTLHLVPTVSTSNP
jgi:hypothetical protein